MESEGHRFHSENGAYVEWATSGSGRGGLITWIGKIWRDVNQVQAGGTSSFRQHYQLGCAGPKGPFAFCIVPWFYIHQLSTNSPVPYPRVRDNLQYPPSMSLGSGRKLELLQESHMASGRACKLYDLITRIQDQTLVVTLMRQQCNLLCHCQIQS